MLHRPARPPGGRRAVPRAGAVSQIASLRVWLNVLGSVVAVIGAGDNLRTLVARLLSQASGNGTITCSAPRGARRTYSVPFLAPMAWAGETLMLGDDMAFRPS
jgi:hypothetical protein